MSKIIFPKTEYADYIKNGKTKQKGIFDPVLDSVKKQRLNRLVNSFIFDDKLK